MSVKNEALNADFYEGLDEFQRLAQAAALETAGNPDRLGVKEVTASRGESAQVIDLGDGRFLASVNEELGTKNIIADAMYELTGKSFDYWLGLDTAAAQFNDLISVGAEPMTSHAHFVGGSKAVFQDARRSQELIRGYKDGCNIAGAAWIGGETGLQEGNVEPGRIVLSGSANGLIDTKDHLVLGDKLAAGDSIIFLPSTGIHSNGSTPTRELAEDLPIGYSTFLREGITYGEALLEPAPFYISAMRALFQAGIDIHYMSNISGHGWRKLMRATKELSYEITHMPDNPPEVFAFIQEHSGKTDKEMYETFNMGLGFAIFVSKDDEEPSLRALRDSGWFAAQAGGRVVEGPKRVDIRPKGIVFGPESLQIR